jgi:hypothetical protein
MRQALARRDAIALSRANASGTARLLQGWDNFYYLIGSASAGLIGLLFVVMTLTAGRERSRILRGAGLYMTPTIVHFGVVLAISAIAMAPALPPVPRGAAFGLFALCGLAASTRGCLGIARLQTAAEPPHWSDLWCYGLAPVAMYLGLTAVIAAAFWERSSWAPYAMAGLLLLLLLLGIRNAWDLVTWMTPGPPNPASTTDHNPSPTP